MSIEVAWLIIAFVLGSSADVYYCANSFVVCFFVWAGCLRRVTVLLLWRC